MYLSIPFPVFSYQNFCFICIIGSYCKDFPTSCFSHLTKSCRKSSKSTHWSIWSMNNYLFNRSPADRHFSCFWCLVITNATGENTLVQVFCVTHVFTSLGSVPVAGSQAWWIFKIKCCVLKQQQQQSEKETLLEFLELLCISECSTASFSLFFPLAWDLSDWWERGISPLALHVTAQLSRSFCERLCFCEYWGAPKGRIMYSEWTLT